VDSLRSTLAKACPFSKLFRPTQKRWRCARAMSADRCCSFAQIDLTQRRGAAQSPQRGKKGQVCFTLLPLCAPPRTLRLCVKPMRAGCCDSVAFGCGPRPRYATCEIRGSFFDCGSAGLGFIDGSARRSHSHHIDFLPDCQRSEPTPPLAGNPARPGRATGATATLN